MRLDKTTAVTAKFARGVLCLLPEARLIEITGSLL